MATGSDSADQSRQSGAGILLIGFVALAALMLSIAALVVAVSSRSQVTSNAAPGDAVVDVPLTEYRIGVPQSLPAGRITFHFTNGGKMTHEVLVFATDLPPSAFPTQADGTVNEDGPRINKVSDGDNIDPGETQTRTVDLSKPGRYVFLCNLPGHFAAGMYTTVTVS